MTQSSTITLVVRRNFPFSAERVFDAWLNPTLARQFLYTTDKSAVVRCEIDARVGGEFVIVDRRENGEEILHRGVYKTIDRPRRLVFTLQVPQYAPEEDDVTVEITPTPTGCEVLLKAVVQTSVLPIASKEDIENGWTMILGSLERTLGNERLGQRTAEGEVTLIRLLPGPVTRVWEYLTDSEKRARWLAAGSLEPRVGGTIELRFLHAALSDEKTPPAKYAELANGHRMTGKVTVYEPPHRLAYTWMGEDELSEVSFTLTAEGERTRLVVRHAKLGNLEMQKSVAAGWHTHLAILVAELTGAKPPPFWSTHAALEREYEQVLARA